MNEDHQKPSETESNERPAPKGEEPAPERNASQPLDPVLEPPVSEPERAPAALVSAAVDRAIEHQMRVRTRRSFIVGGITALAGYGGWHWLRTRREDDGIAWPLRRALEVNEQIARDYFSDARLAPTFSKNSAREPRVNGEIGLDEKFDPADWRLAVAGLDDPTRYESKPLRKAAPTTNAVGSPSGARNDASGDTSDDDDDTDADADQSEDQPDDSDATSAQAADDSSADSPGDILYLTLDDIKALPRVDMVTELKCIEGWSVVVHWTGARFRDFAAKYVPQSRTNAPPDVMSRPDDLVRYASLETPGGGYYVGLEMASALHPQTLLCYEMNGQPLSLQHGAPLRLVTPTKYGIKHLKRIGTIRFTDRRPADYWAEQGYDWYAGH